MTPSAEDEQIPPMCGKAVVDKLLLKTSHSSSNDNKSASSQRQIGPVENITNPKSPRFLTFKRNKKKTPSSYTHVLSPNTDASASPASSPMNGMDKWKSPTAPEEAESIPQFDPKELEVCNEDCFSVEVSHTPTSGSNRSTKTGIKSALKLPSVTEKKKEEDDDNNNTDEESERLIKSVDFSLSTSKMDEFSKRKDKDTKEVLVAMRELVLKQQSALKQLSDKNRTFRRDLSNKIIEIARLKKENTSQADEIKKLQVQKGVAEAETVYLREELKALKGELDILRPKESLSSKNKKEVESIFQFTSMSESRSQSASDDDDDTIDDFRQTMRSLDIVDPESWSPHMCSPVAIGSGSTFAGSSSGSEGVVQENGTGRSDYSESQRDDVGASRSDISSMRDDLDYLSEGKSDILYSTPRKSGSGSNGWTYFRNTPSVSAMSEQSDESGTSDQKTAYNSVSTAQIDDKKNLGNSTQKPVSREDVAVFRERLGLIQKRREERKVERNSMKKGGRRKTMVSFGENSVQSE